jgi:hypothetical protein
MVEYMMPPLALVNVLMPTDDGRTVTVPGRLVACAAEARGVVGVSRGAVLEVVATVVETTLEVETRSVAEVRGAVEEVGGHWSNPELS